MAAQDSVQPGMTGGAREEYFSPEEYARRREAVWARMAEDGYDTLITGCPANVCYLSGFITSNMWDPIFLVLRQENRPLLITWKGERGRVLASLVDSDLDGFDMGADAAAHVVSCLRERSWDRGIVVVDIGGTQTRTDATVRLLDVLDAKQATGLIESVRLIKSPAEIDCMRKAAAFTDKGVEAALAAISEGVRDYEIAAAAADGCWRAGGEFFAMDPNVSVGWKAGALHSNHTGVIARSGDLVFVELSGVYGRYNAPMMRTASVGDPPLPEVRELASVSLAALETVIEAIRPGLAASAVAERGHAAVEQILDRAFYHEIFGYSVGLGLPPTWLEESFFTLTAGNPREIQVGMTFHLPIAFRVVGEYGVGFSETVVVTKSGAEPLGAAPRELAIR